MRGRLHIVIVLPTGIWSNGMEVLPSLAMSHVRVLSRAIGVFSRMRKGKGVIAFWAGLNQVVWARYAFWARGHVATNCRSKKNIVIVLKVPRTSLPRRNKCSFTFGKKSNQDALFAHLQL
ncbi:hypothetical protein Tco_1213128 [Tanacetum coccineum]